MGSFSGIGTLLKDFIVDTLNTVSKTIPGAINELKSNQDELNTNSLKYKQVTGTTDAGGNLVIPASIGQVLSIYPVTVDVAIIKFFTNSFGTRYVTLQKWSNGELLANSNATVNVVYSDV